ncbi:MAG: FtsX-like permease family protein, partial [Gemmatimonadaceae bacterium]
DKENGEVWVPFSAYTALVPGVDAQSLPVDVVGRLRSGVELKVARARLDLLATQLAHSGVPSGTATDQGLSAQVLSLREVLTQQARPSIWLLLSAAILLNLIAVVNASSLLLARVSARAKEMAVRRALGASGSAIVRLLVIEATVLVGSASTLGLVVSLWATPVLLSLGTALIPDVGPIGLDLPVIALDAAAAAAATLLLGLPAGLLIVRLATRVSLGNANARLTTFESRTRARSLVLATQMALTLSLLVAMGLLLRSMQRLTSGDRGYDGSNVVTASLSLPADRYATPEQRLAFADALRSRVSDIPGVRSVAVSTGAPVLRGPITFASSSLTRVEKDSSKRVAWWTVTPNYFQLLRMATLRGQQPSAAILSGDLVIDSLAASVLFPHGNAIGGMVRLANRQEVRVGSIVRDIQEYSLDPESHKRLLGAEPHVYGGIRGDVGWRIHVLVESTGAPEALVVPLRAAIADADPQLAPDNVRSLPEQLGLILTRERLLSTLVALAALISLVLAAGGMYALASYSVAQRLPEIGIRLALGARGSDIILSALGQMLVVALAGVAAGLVVALSGGRLIQAFLYDVSAHDPIALGVSACLLVGVSVSATYLAVRSVGGNRSVRALLSNA